MIDVTEKLSRELPVKRGDVCQGENLDETKVVESNENHKNIYNTHGQTEKQFYTFVCVKSEAMCFI